MMDEENVENCILCCQPCDKLEKAIKVVDWENVEVKASKWKGSDKYSDVYDSFDWEEGSTGLVWHKSCKIEICGERKLQEALNRKRKNNTNAVKQEVQIERPSAPPRKTTRQSVRIVRQKNLWCSVWKEMTCQNIFSGTNSARFVKISFGKILKFYVCAGSRAKT